MEQAEQAELKRSINNFIWEQAPGNMTLNRAEEIAVMLFDAFQQQPASQAYSPPEEAG